jgi:CubicO group peptidase (beta-lactamase class C family)
LVLLAAACACGASCAPTTECIVEDPAPGIARLRSGGSVRHEVDLLVAPLIGSGEVRGMIVGVLDAEGRTEVFRYGRVGEDGDARPPDADTLFQVGSVTKVFVAALLAVLVDEGTLSLDDTVREILPADVPLSADAADLTLDELVTHTSGLPREARCLNTIPHFLGYLFTGHNLYAYFTKDFLYGYLARCRLSPRAERGVEYSNLATGLLAHLMEVKTGRPLADLVREKVTDPLGMHDTCFSFGEGRRERLALGHVGGHPILLPRSATLRDWNMGEVLQGTGGLYTSLDDLMKWARLNLGLEAHPLARVLAPLQVSRFTTPSEDVAMGWIINRFDEGRLSIVYKYGIVSGYSAYLGLVPDRRVAVAVLSNTFNWHDKVGHNLLLRLAGSTDLTDPSGASAPPAPATSAPNPDRR